MTTRRQFLTHSCALGVASPTLTSALLSLGRARQAAAQTASDYKALVCILLAGGNDSYNMLVPADADQYSAYAGIRSDLALPSTGLLPLATPAANGQRYALHPGMSGLRSLVDNGDAAMVANIGTLLEPFDAGAVENGVARLPVGLFSHADQINQWQTAIPDGRTSKGWAGRVADRMQSITLQNGISMNISLSGTNVFQSGTNSVEYSVSPEGVGANSSNSYRDGTAFGDFRTRILDEVLAVSQPHALRREFSQRFRSAIDSQAVFADAMSQATQLTTPFSAGPLSASLRQIARIISVRQELGAARQTFFVTVGGWDHHDEVLANQATMLPAVSSALVEFRNALVELGMFEDVTAAS